MALDEFLFAKLSGYFKKSKKITPQEEERTVRLEDIRDKLTILARANTGRPIDVFPAEREGGYKNNSFFLPTSFSFFNTKNENLQFYIFRILYLSVQQKLRINWQYQNEENSLEVSRQKSVLSSPSVLGDLFDEYPSLRNWYDSFYYYFNHNDNQQADLSWLFGKWMLNTPEEPDQNTLQHISNHTKKAEQNAPVTTLKAKIVEEINRIEIDKKQQEDYVLTHNFEKVETAEEFDGVWRDFDGNDDLKDHQEALSELNMKFTVRVDDPAHSVYQAEFIENTSVSESAELDSSMYCISYPEWDYKKNAYKEHFCKVYPGKLEKSDANYYQKAIHKNAATLTGLRKMLTSINNKQRQHRRQLQGDEFDIDAITDLYIDVHSKHTPSEKIYIANKKTEKELSILLLLDVSLSTDGYANGNRVIDVEKEVSILFGEILHEFNIDFSIACFFSKTRNFSTYQTLKDFDDDWQKSKYIIGAAQPEGYTRIGAAIRHAGALLEKRASRNKWLILLSDGKPNDFDKYEGKYGINDVKQALMELNRQQIHSYALAIEAQAKYYLPQMFGQNHYQILTTPVELLQAMVKLYEKIKR